MATIRELLANAGLTHENVKAGPVTCRVKATDGVMRGSVPCTTLVVGDKAKLAEVVSSQDKIEVTTCGDNAGQTATFTGEQFARIAGYLPPVDPEEEIRKTEEKAEKIRKAKAKRDAQDKSTVPAVISDRLESSIPVNGQS